MKDFEECYIVHEHAMGVNFTLTFVNLYTIETDVLICIVRARVLTCEKQDWNRLPRDVINNIIYRRFYHLHREPIECRLIVCIHQYMISSSYVALFLYGHYDINVSEPIVSDLIFIHIPYKCMQD